MKLRLFEDVKKIFADKECELLTTEEEFKNIKDRQPKYKYIAKCGHEHEVFWNVYVSRNTGIFCPPCVIKRNAITAKENNKDDKLQNLKLEKRCCEYFMDKIKDKIDIIRTFDGCNADLVMKPKSVKEDLWVGIQVKTNAYIGPSYGFSVNKNYADCLMLFMCWEDKRMWICPYEDISHLKKLTIGVKKSKYNHYEVLENDLYEKLLLFYGANKKSSFEVLDTPTSEYQQREKLYRIHREYKLSFIKFIENGMEGLVYDFFINDKKFQEKVGSIYKNKYMFSLYKNNGKKDGKRAFKCYNKNDNDFYWLNCPDKKYFYVFPQDILIKKQYIDSENKKKMHLSCDPQNDKCWRKDYLFDYDNIDKERLLNLINS
jgi:hypothetical protein